MSKWRKMGTYLQVESNEVNLEEGKMKELHGYIAKGMSAQQISKKMNVDVKTIETLMKEEIELDEKEIKYDGKGPVKMSKKEYDKINKFRKGSIRGDLYVMATNPKGFNVLVPVIFEEVEIQEQFSTGMIDKLRKAYGPMKGKKIVPGPLMKTFDKIDKNKDALIQLYKADIPFVSQMAVSRLISKHNMKGKDINKLREDAPTNSVAGGGVDMNPTGLSKKKKELDGRTKEYKIHANKLTAQREKRLKKKEMIKGSFVKEVVESISKFAREEFIEEDNVDILRDIVKRKQAKPIKLKDGQMKIDMQSANAIIKNLVDAPKNMMKDETRKKVMNIINKGNKTQFLRLIDMLYK